MTFSCRMACLAAVLISADGRTRADLEPIPPLSEAVDIKVFPGPGGWILEFFSDGSAHAHYGALPGDGASLPPGAVIFDALLDAVRRLRLEKEGRSDTQVAVRRKGSSTSSAFYVSDDTLFRYLVASFRGKWKPDGPRFAQLLNSSPIYPPEKER